MNRMSFKRTALIHLALVASILTAGCGTSLTIRACPHCNTEFDFFTGSVIWDENSYQEQNRKNGENDQKTMRENGTNENSAESQVLPVNTILEGEIGFNGDNEDWFKIIPPSDGNLVVSGENISSQKSNVGRISLLNDKMNEVRHINYLNLSAAKSRETQQYMVKTGDVLYLKISEHAGVQKERAKYRIAARLE